MVIALAGNPNSGKTTVFNRLTGARQHVGNYPGVTVERKAGSLRHGGVELEIVDLPGTYSLTVSSLEEKVARNFIIDGHPEVVVDVIDASNLERNLYLAVQLMEAGAPLVLAFNMTDTTREMGMTFDLAKLTEAFGAPVVQTTGRQGEGMTELLAAAIEVARHAQEWTGRTVNYGPLMETEIARLQTLLTNWTPASRGGQERWLAIKLLENDPELTARYAESGVAVAAGESRSRIEHELGQDASSVIAGRRYEFIAETCRQAVTAPATPHRTVSDRIDAVVTHRFLGLPLFLALMYLVFQLTFTVSAAPMAWIESFCGWLGGSMASAWPAESMLRSLVIDGLIAGVGGVLVFMPNILCLFLAIAVLEDSGYMARTAFMMDRLMHKIGLHGKSFIPMLIGFGCSVPAIMATRTLENRRDRLVTMLVIPLMSCGARFPIYSLIIPAFFPPVWRAPMLLIIYVIGILLAIGCAKLLRSTALKGESVPFIMELPPYRMPALRGIALHMWERGSLYIRKAGTIILCLSIVLWAMTNYPKKTMFQHDYEAEIAQTRVSGGAEVQPASKETATRITQEQRAEMLAYSVAGRIGHALEPALTPLGFDWRIGTALVGAFAAKEVFVAQMGIVFSVGDADLESAALREKLRANYPPLTGFCILLFCLISTPCMATIATTRKESGSWWWAIGQWVGLSLIAYLLTLIVCQSGRILGIGV